MQALVQEYLAEVGSALSRLSTEDIETVTEILFYAYRNDKQIFTFGNGASAALASHMACDLGKGTAPDVGERDLHRRMKRLRIMSLNDNTPLFSAISNDVAYDAVYVEQLRNLLNDGDVVIGISGSGGSPNVLRALEFARHAGATTIGLTGSQPSRVRIEAVCDVCLAVPLPMMEQIEDIHVIISHLISVGLRDRIHAYQTTSRLLQSLTAAVSD